MAHTAEHRARWLAPALLALGIAGFAAAWILVALSSGSQANWMAPLAGLDVALMLRLAGTRRGGVRVLLALAATVATIAIASWGITASEIGRSVGAAPWASAFKLGPAYAFTLLRLANSAADLAWLGAGLVVAAVTAR